MGSKNAMRGVRVLRGITRGEAADGIGVTAETIGRWERGDSEPTRPYLIKLAEMYGVSIDQLVGIEDVVTSK